MKNYYDAHGNMNEVTSSLDRIGKYRQNVAKRQKREERKVKPRKISLLKVLALSASVGAVVVGLSYAMEYNTRQPVTPERKSRYELLVQARQIYEKALQSNADHETLNGIEDVIRDLENGKSF